MAVGAPPQVVDEVLQFLLGDLLGGGQLAMSVLYSHQDASLLELHFRCLGQRLPDGGHLGVGPGVILRHCGVILRHCPPDVGNFDFMPDLMVQDKLHGPLDVHGVPMIPHPRARGLVYAINAVVLTCE
ncbi:hypothetical protein SBA4_830045 [Candidatus Sulfopaludibacter sp. SbA4]|nr:hypothetical protein SBA4_830045 [Candidatus Sulfopaludibacter sp. SbA4]